MMETSLKRPIGYTLPNRITTSHAGLPFRKGRSLLRYALRIADGGIDLPPPSRVNLKLVKSVNLENDGHEEQQIYRRTDSIGFLRQAEAGLAVKELCRSGGFSDATFYKWRAKFGGMQVSQAQRLRELESENAKLKRLLAEAHLDMHALKSVLGVKR